LLQSIVVHLASVPPVKILKISQLLNLREFENRRRQNTPLITTAPRKAKLFNIRYRRLQRREPQNSSSAQPATATIETDSIEEVVNFFDEIIARHGTAQWIKAFLEWRVH
jgi:DNA polymerase III sliding clamp (beta) subunit (PCNA family)